MPTTASPAPPLALTMGEPSGIAAEITLKAWRELKDCGPAFAMLGDPGWLDATATALSLRIPIRPVRDMAEAATVFAQALPVLPIHLPRPATPGHPDPALAGAIIDSITRAVALAQSGEAEGVVTNPIQKSTMTLSGFAFPGHTEFMEHLAGDGVRASMMLIGGGLRVIPVTIHEPLRQAVARLSTAMIVAAGRDAAEALRQDFGLACPRIAVAGLNPHAGEDGTLGREEIEIIAPAVEALRRAGIRAFGPIPPDTMFTPAARAGYDVALCMYHDQGLIPLKTLDMMGGVNVTLGLPFVRTSPDHGTALDIAGAGKASAASLIAAIRLADDLARTRRLARRSAA